MLKISKEISFPIDVVTQTLAAIGRKGAGKTYLATMIAEQMIDARAQIVVIDPVGNWWGLRVGEDGRTKGKDIFVIGGDHGDIPLVPEAGAKIARLIVEKNISAILDVSGFRIGEHKRFAAEFAEEFFHLKKSHKTPVHIFIEEAQKLIPQRVGPDEMRMVGAFEQIVRLGRNYGIGATLITQRPQSVNKEVLSQVECLCVLQVTGPHERKALEEWVYEAGADRELVGYLPGLAQGEGYVWSPSWLRKYERVHFAKKSTFDASATPEVGKAEKAAKLSDVDVEALRKDMAEVVEAAEKDDPKALRRKINELKKELLSVGKDNKPVQTKIEKIEVPVIGKRAFIKFEESEKEIRKMLVKAHDFCKAAEKANEIIIVAVDKLSAEIKKVQQQNKSQFLVKKIVPVAPLQFHYKKPLPTKINSVPFLENLENNDNDELTNPERRIINAIAWLHSIGIPDPSKIAVSFLAGYTFGSGGFNNPCGALRTKGLVEYRPANRIVLTDEGNRLAEVPDEPLTQEELHEKVMAVLPTPEQRILKPLLEAYPEAISNEELAQASGYMAGSGGFNNPKGRLRTLGLIEYPQGNYSKAADILFI